MIAVTSAGLPDWPTLWFDARRKRAFIEARSPTWRGYEWGMKWAKAGYIAGLLPAAWIAFRLTPSFDLRFLELIWGTLLWAAVVKFWYLLLKRTLPGVLARQFFARTVKLWFTTGAIAFQSRLYQRPVLLSRTWDGDAIKMSFAIEKDSAAECAEASKKLEPGQGAETFHLKQARRLKMNISGVSQRHRVEGPASLIRRSIPVCEMPEPALEKLVVVIHAAQLLTEETFDLTDLNQIEGIDIDG
ncbi:MAG: hypothetical protein AAFX06_21595 [Planctomycetota bacterium]